MLIQWLKEGGNVGIHGIMRLPVLRDGNIDHHILDATNSTRARR